MIWAGLLLPFVTIPEEELNVPFIICRIRVPQRQNFSNFSRYFNIQSFHFWVCDAGQARLFQKLRILSGMQRFEEFIIAKGPHRDGVGFFPDCPLAFTLHDVGHPIKPQGHYNT